MAPISTEELREARDQGVVLYLCAFVHLMARELGIDDSDNDAMNMLAVKMVEGVNAGTQAAICSLMDDRRGAEKAMEDLRIFIDINLA